jgi:signal transduction histidine kinase
LLHTRTGSTHPILNRKVHSVLDHIDSTMKAMRSIINNLRPTVLDLGLNAAMEWQVKEFQRRTGIVCELSMPEEELILDDERATALFRILQESLNNILRHAKATGAQIELYNDNGKLYMKVADNGVGMFPDCRRKANSFGLVGIKERVSSLGGELVIENGSDKGTRLTVCLPMKGNATETQQDVDLIADVLSSFGKLAPSDETLKIPPKATVTARRRKEARAGKVDGLA